MITSQSEIHFHIMKHGPLEVVKNEDEITPAENIDGFKFITKIVCKVHDISIYEVFDKTRKRIIVGPRQMIMYFSWKYLEMSITEIGYRCGMKDHGSVSNARIVFENLYDTDKNYRKRADHIKNLITLNKSRFI